MYDSCLTSAESYRLVKKMKDFGCTKLYGMSFEKTYTASARDGRVRDLFSYDTNIASYYCKKKVLYVNLDYFRCSNTTIRHFVNWLHILGFEGAYSIIKKLAEDTKKEMAKMYIPELTGEMFYIDNYGLWVTFI